MSSSMPPPPAPLAHRRSTRLITHQLPPSPPSSPEATKCFPRKMSLSKGATFHYSSSPPADDDPVLSIRHLARRSPTCSQSMLASWLSDKKDIAQSLADFEHTFSGARGRRISSRRRSAQEFEQQLRQRTASLSSDEGLGSSVSSVSDKSLSQKFERALDLISDKDSGLGTSIADKESVVVGRPSEEDPSVQELIQETDDSAALPKFRQRSPSRTSGTQIPSTTSAVTQSIAPPTRNPKRHPPLSSFARKKISQLILDPILKEERFEDFHPLVASLSSRSNKAIRCLRDLEQSLIFQPLTLAITSHLYRTFGEFSIQLVVDTYRHLSEPQQRRAADRPYDNGYFLDLVQQVGRLAAQVGTIRNQPADSAEEDDEMAYSPDDEVTLEGGLGATGDIAELVRWKNGKGISLRTGQPYEPTPGIKREASSALDEDAARSMARRKKGYIPEIVEMECSDPTCGKIFTRKCDLAKHEKTHSRPFKCPNKTCKYHDMGLPTEKERDRHINDKHDPNPQYYKCNYCEFRTKRESNCKQHMEKKHNWHYERAKGKDKNRMTPVQTPQTPAMDYSGMQSPATYTSTPWDDSSSIAGSITGSIANSVQLTPFEQPGDNFGGLNQATTYSAPLFPRDAYQPTVQTNNFDFNNFNPAQQYISPTNSTPANMTTPATPAYSNITNPSPFPANMDVTMDYNNCDNGAYHTLPTPESFLQPHSRNPSISNPSPMFADDNMYDGPTLPSNNFNDPVISGHNMSIPDNDFALFRTGNRNTSPFSNPDAAGQMLFPPNDADLPSASQFAALDNDATLMFEAEYDGEFDYGMTSN